MLNFLEIIELISAIVLILTVLIQNRGTGLGETFGGEGNVYSTRRSMEKVFFNMTIASSAIFFGSAIVILYLS